jgi:hypothetical protein
MAAILRLWTFDHHACDTALRKAHIDIWNINLNKGPADSSIWSGLVAIAIFETLVLVGAYRSYNRIEPYDKTRKRFPIFVGGFMMGLFVFGVQLHAIGEYVDTCRRLLSVPP